MAAEEFTLRLEVRLREDQVQQLAEGEHTMALTQPQAEVRTDTREERVEAEMLVVVEPDS